MVALSGPLLSETNRTPVSWWGTRARPGGPIDFQLPAQSHGPPGSKTVRADKAQALLVH